MQQTGQVGRRGRLTHCWFGIFREISWQREKNRITPALSLSAKYILKLEIFQTFNGPPDTLKLRGMNIPEKHRQWWVVKNIRQKRCSNIHLSLLVYLECWQGWLARGSSDIDIHLTGWRAVFVLEGGKIRPLNCRFPPALWWHIGTTVVAKAITQFLSLCNKMGPQLHLSSNHWRLQMYSKRTVMKLVMLMQLHLSWAIYRRDLSRGASTAFCLCLFLGPLWL